MTIEERLASLGLELPVLGPYEGAFLPGVLVGSLAFLSAQAWTRDGKPVVAGTVGDVVDIETAGEAARRCTLNALAAAKLLIGSLDQIERVVRLSGYVASAPGFDKQSSVLNAASTMLVDIFGEKGRHARTSLGVSGLTGGASVLVELTLEKKR
jgi:enamine deaminase RidA (YjgF/YER057c/UK114 family)